MERRPNTEFTWRKMSVHEVVLLSAVLGLCLSAVLPVNSALTIDQYDFQSQDGNEDYFTSNNNDLDSRIMKRFYSCVSRGNNCDHRPEDCCPNTSCRCNLWGANCRCQRKGIFTKLII